MAEVDIDVIRGILGEIGREQHLVEEDEIQIAVSANTIYADYQEIVEVGGVWLASDPDKSGTNYFTGGTFNKKSGIITLGTAVNPSDEVIVLYARKHGLTDAEIQIHYDAAKIYISFLLHYDEYEFDTPTESLDVLARYTAYNVAVYYCIITMNMGNLIMSGFNYRMEEFEIQTKLWGEGMIAQELFGMVRARVEDLIKRLADKTGVVLATGRGYTYLSGYPLHNNTVRRIFSRAADFHSG